jgi:hypothetical protein
MAAWDLEPWGNDLAADWFAGFFKGVKANARIRRAFKDRNDLPVIRAACFLLGSLGRAYVWPDNLDELKQLLDQGIALLSRMAKPTPADRADDDFLEYWDDDPAFRKAVKVQITELRQRRAELQG